MALRAVPSCVARTAIARRTLGSSHLRRQYATAISTGSTPRTTRNAVGVISDNGRVPWKDLSVGEKAARTTQQTFNGSIILAGAVMSCGVAYLLYTEVFSQDSKIRQFNQAVDRLRADSTAKELLGSDKKIRAFGEPTFNKWARARPIASRVERDQTGTEHLIMHFNVQGSTNSGVVALHMIKSPEHPHYQYKYLYLDVRGKQRYYLENADTVAEKLKPRLSIFGVPWR